MNYLPTIMMGLLIIMLGVIVLAILLGL
jgi:hypothetical protein